MATGGDAHTIESMDQRMPETWQRRMVRYASLESRLSHVATSKRSAAEQDFFVKFWSEVEKVNEHFKRAATEVVQAHRRRSNWLTAVWGTRKIRLPDGEVVVATPENIRLQSRICLEYARKNAEGIKKIAEAHDEAYGNEAGKIVYDSMWRDQSGLAAFLHSPLLLELEAVNMATEREARSKKAKPAARDADGNEDDEGVEVLEEMRSLSEPMASVSMKCRVELEESQKCPICLDILFKPVGLACGHKFCQSCLFKAVLPGVAFGSVQGLLNVIPPQSRCPQCRQMGVFENAAALPVLGAYLKQMFPQYWRERHESHRREDRIARARILKQLEVKYGGLGITYPQLILYG